MNRYRAIFGAYVRMYADCDFAAESDGTATAQAIKEFKKSASELDWTDADHDNLAQPSVVRLRDIQNDRDILEGHDFAANEEDSLDYAARDLLASLKEIVFEVDQEIEQRQTGGNDENWSELQRRGDLTLWIDAAVAGWRAEPRTTPGGQRVYSDLAIRVVLTLRTVFRLALRQAEGFVGSVLRLLGAQLAVPDHSTLSRRGRRFAYDTPTVSAGEPRHLVIHSTGLQLFGRGAWHADKHGESRRSWRKLHLVVDAETGEIVASNLTDNGSDDAGEVPFLLAQIEGPIASVTADGAYDSEPTYQAVAAKQSDPPSNVVIPPRVTAIPSGSDTARDRHIAAIAERGRMAWQKATGYGRRNLVETAIGRYKAIIGPRLRSRNWRAQKAETVIGVEVLNRMIRVAKPVSVQML